LEVRDAYYGNNGRSGGDDHRSGRNDRKSDGNDRDHHNNESIRVWCLQGFAFQQTDDVADEEAWAAARKGVEDRLRIRDVVRAIGFSRMFR
jgi:hypothetical protein